MKPFLFLAYALCVFQFLPINIAVSSTDNPICLESLLAEIDDDELSVEEVSELLENTKKKSEIRKYWALLYALDASRGIDWLSTHGASHHFKFEAAQFVLALNPSGGLETVKSMGLSQDQLYELVTVLARKYPAGDETIARLAGEGIFNEAQKRELFSIRWDVNHSESGDEHQDLFHLYNFDGNEAFFKVLCRYAAKEPTTFIDEFEDDIEGLSSEQRVKIGQILALEVELDEDAWISSLNLNFNERAEVAKVAITRMINDWGWKDEYLAAYMIDDSNWFELDEQGARTVLRYVIENVRRAKLFRYEDRMDFIEEWYPSFVSDSQEESIINSWLYERDPLTAMGLAMDVDSPHSLPLSAPDSEDSLKSLIQDYIEGENRANLPSQPETYLWDKVEDPAIVERLLQKLVRHPGLLLQPHQNSSLHILAGVTGLNSEILSTAQITRRLNPFFKLLLDLQDEFDAPVYDGIHFSEEVYADSDMLMKFSGQLRDLKYLLGTHFDWAQLQTELFENKEAVSLEQLKQAAIGLRERIHSEMRRALGFVDITLSEKELKSLEEEWGELGPVYTLVARFYQKKQWHKYLKLIGQILKAGARDTFEELKFEGERGVGLDEVSAKSQLSILEDEDAIEEWVQGRSRVSLLKKNGSESEEQEDVDYDYSSKRQELLSLYPDISVPVRMSPDLVAELKQTVLSENFLRGNPHTAMLEIISKAVGADGEDDAKLEVALESLNYLLNEFEGVEIGSTEFVTTLKAISTLTRLSSSQIGEETLREINPLLKEIQTTLKPKRKSENSQILLSVTSSDPLFSIMVGELVQVTSCLSYQTGGMIASLLGYTIDANSQIMASYVVRQDHFNSYQEYQAVVDAISSKKLRDVVWDGNRRQATFLLRGSGELKEVVTQDLGYSYLRQVMKLGESVEKKGRAGLKLEKEYFQDHPGLEILRNQHKSLFKEVAQSIGATTKGRVRMPQSRNPGGVYSDKAEDNGVKKGAYVIP